MVTPAAPPLQGQSTTSSPAVGTVVPSASLEQQNFGKINNVSGPNQRAYADPNSQAIQNQIAAGQGAINYNPTAAQTQLAPTAQYGSSSIAPLMMLGGANIGTNVQNTNASAQMQAINNLNNIAQGNGPNAATIAASQQAQQNVAAQIAASAAAGGNPALAGRNIANATAAQNQQAAANAVLGSAQEQLGAQGTLQSALGNITQTGQAIPLAQAQMYQQAGLANQGVEAQGALTQAGMNQAASAANAGALNTAALQQGTMNQQVGLQNVQNMSQLQALQAQQSNAMLNAGMQQNSYDIAQQQNYQTAYQQYQANMEALANGSAIAGMQQQGQIIGAAAGGVGAIGAGALTAATAPSDRRLKKEVKSAKRDIAKFFNTFANIKVRQYA